MVHSRFTVGDVSRMSWLQAVRTIVDALPTDRPSVDEIESKVSETEFSQIKQTSCLEKRILFQVSFRRLPGATEGETKKSSDSNCTFLLVHGFNNDAANFTNSLGAGTCCC